MEATRLGYATAGLLILLVASMLAAPAAGGTSGEVVYNASGIFIRLPAAESVELKGVALSATLISNSMARLTVQALHSDVDDLYVKVMNSTGGLLAELRTDFSSSSTATVDFPASEPAVVVEVDTADGSFVGLYALTLTAGEGAYAAYSGLAYVLLCVLIVAPMLAAGLRFRVGLGAVGVIALAPACWMLAKLLGAGPVADAVFAVGLLLGALLFFASGGD